MTSATGTIAGEGRQDGREGAAATPPGRLFFHTDLFEFLESVPGEEILLADGRRFPGPRRLKLEKTASGAIELLLPVLPEGQFEHPWYGTLVWDRPKFAQMRDNFHDGVMGSRPFLGIDHERLNFFSSRAPAAGWITDLEHDEEAALFLTRVELTQLGLDNIEGRLYRYTSAEVADTYKNSRGEAYNNVLVGNTLTNTPFHDTMPGLFGAEPSQAIALSSRGPHTLWAPGRPLTTDEARAIWPGFSLPIAGAMAQPMEERSMSAPRTRTENPPSAEPVVAAATEPATEPVALTEPQASARPVAAEPEGVLLTANPAVAEMISLTRDQWEQVQAQIALGVQANEQLMRQSIRNRIAPHVAAGRIPRKKEEAAFNLALAAPEEFAAYFDEDLPACLPLETLGFAGGADRTPAGQEAGRAGSGAQEFTAIVMRIRQEAQANGRDVSMDEAISLARSENPAAHRAYVTRNRQKTNGNGR